MMWHPLMSFVLASYPCSNLSSWKCNYKCSNAVQQATQSHSKRRAKAVSPNRNLTAILHLTDKYLQYKKGKLNYNAKWLKDKQAFFFKSKYSVVHLTESTLEVQRWSSLWHMTYPQATLTSAGLKWGFIYKKRSLCVNIFWMCAAFYHINQILPNHWETFIYHNYFLPISNFYICKNHYPNPRSRSPPIII